MLEDREYMRASQHRNGMSVTLKLVIILATAFSLQCINDVYLKANVEHWFALTRQGFGHGWLWQLLSFQFLHQNLTHIIFNLISLWMFGRFVENVLGTKRFLVAMFGCGVVGGLLQGALMLLFPLHYGFVVVGASAGVSGLIAIFCLIQRDSEVRLNFILPVPAIALFWLLLGISLFFTLVPTSREMGVAHAAHLGGLLAGVAWVKFGWHHDFNQLPWERWFTMHRGADSRKSRRPSAGPSRRSGSAEGRESAETFISTDVDAILDKISAQGIQSLTDAERKVLEAARKKMGSK
ncbi:MAG: rhomboid family intramembrane serine protease [Verrucomicrobia bacterium]|nr:rhomboid family intramembrane serine protease [Verrucomicrobiota bacterium]